MSSPDTDTVTIGPLTRLVLAILRSIDRLLGRAPATTGDVVVFTDAALAADTGSRSAVVHQVAAPRETRDGLGWALLIEPIEPPQAHRDLHSSDTTDWRFWVTPRAISTDPNECVDGREIAAATQADYVGLIPAAMLDQYVERALEDIGFTATVQWDHATQSITASLAAPTDATTPTSPIDTQQPPIDLTARRSTGGPPTAPDREPLAAPDGATDADVKHAVTTHDHNHDHEQHDPDDSPPDSNSASDRTVTDELSLELAAADTNGAPDTSLPDDDRPA